MDKFITKYPVKPSNISLFQTNSERIALSIISKLISYAITESHIKNNITNNINNYCATTLIKQISSYISMQYISFESDDKINQKVSKTIFFDVTKEGDNYWDDIPQPKPNSLDRYSDNENILIERIIAPSSSTPILPLVKNKVTNNSKLMKFGRAFIKNNLKIMDKPKMIIDLPSFMIKNHFMDEIIKKEKERKRLESELKEDMKKKEEEKQKIIQKNKEREAKIAKIVNESKKKYAYFSNPSKKKFTLDAKGDIVLIKGVDLKKLTPQFYFGDSYTKECKVIMNHYSSNTNIISNDEKEVIKKDNQKEKKKVKKDLKIKNFIPGGSSFNLIKPEVGVRISEDNKIKSGGNNFLKKFHKYSTDTFQNFKTQISPISKTIKKQEIIKESEEKKEKEEKKENQEEVETVNKNQKDLIQLKVKKNIIKNILDNLDLVDEKELLQNKKSKTTTNFFKPKSNIIHDLERKKYEEINKFNIKIITNCHWGFKNVPDFPNNTLYPKIPNSKSKKKIILDTNNLIQPRIRKKSLITPKKMNRTSSCGFFKMKKN